MDFVFRGVKELFRNCEKSIYSEKEELFRNYEKFI